MTKVTDPTSRAVALVYDSSGHLVTVKTPSGQEKKLVMYLRRRRMIGLRSQKK